jgi:hypothetical protein
MEKWEYKRVRIASSLEHKGDDFEEWAIHRLNRYGKEGWEACNLREDQQCWLVLLKQKVA